MAGLGKSRAVRQGATFPRMAKQEPGKTGRRTAGGLVHVMVVLDPRHLAALKAEADRRAPPGSRRSDSSAVLREILDAWLARHRPPKS